MGVTCEKLVMVILSSERLPPHFLFLQASSHFHATHYFTHTTAVQSPSYYQWYILIGKQWHQLPEFIPSNSNSGLYSCISISIHTQHVTWITKLILQLQICTDTNIYLCDLYWLLDSSNLWLDVENDWDLNPKYFDHIWQRYGKDKSQEALLLQRDAQRILSTVTTKVTFKLTELTHSCYSIGHTWFHFSLPL